jgi:hypothetical protein
MRKYNSMYERLVANSKPEHDGANACWLWTGPTVRGYPIISVRKPGRRAPVGVRAHRLMLEEVHNVLFPFDEAGHRCWNPSCVNPSHLEIQTPAFNKSERRGYASVDGRMIPVLFPRGIDYEALLDRPSTLHPAGAPCPF